MKKYIPTKQSIIEWFKAIGISFVCVLMIRTFLSEISPVGSPSMEKSLMTGDYMFINKLSYGPRLLKTLFSIPFINQSYYSDVVSLPYMRLFGSPDVERNEVVVFNYPMEDEFPVDHRTYFVKRCVAIPGDSFKIADGLVYVNNKLMDDENSLQFNYHLKSDKVLDSVFTSQYNLVEGGKYLTITIIHLHLQSHWQIICEAKHLLLKSKKTMRKRKCGMNLYSHLTLTINGT